MSCGLLRVYLGVALSHIPMIEEAAVVVAVAGVTTPDGVKARSFTLLTFSQIDWLLSPSPSCVTLGFLVE